MSLTHPQTAPAPFPVQAPAQASAVPATMRAIVRDHYGSADQLQVREVATPTPGPNQVLVQVGAAGLDRGAWHFMTGRPLLLRYAGFGVRRPKQKGLGSELAGVVQAVGQGVTDFRPGDRVFGTGQGAFAGYALARPDKLAILPPDVSFEDAAALPISAVTALQALRDHGAVQPGQRVLVIGASGGVGAFAVQIARVLGARVTGVCSAAKADFVRALGAEEVIDYRQQGLGTLPGRYDLVLDIAGNRPIAQLRGLLTPSGTLVVVGGEDGNGWSGSMSRQMIGVLRSLLGPQKVKMFIATPNRADFQTLSGWLSAGKLRPALDRVCGLADVPQAMRDLGAGRVRGKVVIRVG